MRELATRTRPLPPMPPQIAALRQHRGYPVPWFVADIDGVPDFRIMDPRKLERAVKRELCWVCGQPLGGYAASVIGPMCAVNRVSAEPPTHPGCGIWSAHACPFLTRPHAKRRDVEGAVAAPGIALMRNPGVALVWIARTITAERQPEGGFLFRLADPTRVRWYAEGRKATRAEVEASIDSGLPALRDLAEQDGPAAGRPARADGRRRARPAARGSFRRCRARGPGSPAWKAAACGRHTKGAVVTRMLMMISREVRHVPLDFKPPMTSHLDPRAMTYVERAVAHFAEFYVPVIERWLEERAQWERGEHPNQQDRWHNDHPPDHDYPEGVKAGDLMYPPGTPFEKHEEPPRPDAYWPGREWPEGAEIGIQMYETVSEGTPISSVYPNTDEGRRSMANELAGRVTGITSDMTANQWMQVIEGQVLAKDIHTGAVVGPGG